jgi:hypothetical protein
MLRNTIIVAAVVASFALMCRAQVPGVKPTPTQIAQVQQMQQAASEASKSKTENPPSHRVQVLLLEIKANAEHPKLTALRAEAQSGKATAGLIAIADELIAAGVGSTSCNVTMIVNAGSGSEWSNNEDVPYQVSDEQNKVVERGARSIGYRLECNSSGSTGEKAAISLSFECTQFPHSKREVEGFREKKSIRWRGAWSGMSGSEAVLTAETPRKHGVAVGDVPTERYLLLRVDPQE